MIDPRNKALAELVFGWKLHAVDSPTPWSDATGVAKVKPPDFLGDDVAFGTLLDKAAALGVEVTLHYDKSRKEWQANLGYAWRGRGDRRAALVDLVLAVFGREYMP